MKTQKVTDGKGVVREFDYSATSFEVRVSAIRGDITDLDGLKECAQAISVAESVPKVVFSL